MAQDLRELFGNDNEPEAVKLQEGHRERFEAKLDAALPQKKSRERYLFLRIAAVIVVAVGVGFALFAPGLHEYADPGNGVAGTPGVEEAEAAGEMDASEESELQNTLQVSDVSPEFKKVETYYLASLNFELAKLEVTPENKALLDAFMDQLAELEKEYQRLNKEFMEVGANEQTVEAMIVNLQLRLELLYKVKNKIKEIKESKNRNYENLQA